jgi:hypothetical protein
MVKKIINKKHKKHNDKQCYFCNESDYDLLDCHRIIPGSENGKYTDWNTIVCCSCCHRKCHSGRIKVLGKYFSTSGKWVLNYIEDGEEKWK